MLRVIKELRPTWVIGENVAGIVSMALDTVLSDLESIGYTCQAFVIPACAVDAPHRRDRCAIVAYNANSDNAEAVKAVCRRSNAEPSGSSKTVADANGNGFLWVGSKSAVRRNTDQKYSPVTKSRNVPDTDSADVERAGTPQVKTGQPQFTDGDRRSAQPGLGGVADGLPRWLDEPGDVPRIATGVKDRANRLKCLGNAVVPQ